MAVWVDDRLVLAFPVRSKPWEADIRAQAVRRVAEVARKNVVWQTEDQFLGRDDPDRWKSSVKVAESAARWEELALLTGYAVARRVSPQVWRAAFSLNSRKGQRSIDGLLRERQLGKHASDSDVSAAILIGLWAHVARFDRVPEGLAQWVLGMRWKHVGSKRATR